MKIVLPSTSTIPPKIKLFLVNIDFFSKLGAHNAGSSRSFVAT